MQPLELRQEAAVYRFRLLGGIVETSEVLGVKRPHEVNKALTELSELPLSKEMISKFFKKLFSTGHL
ncbi:hypothetical protein [Deinococcus sp.]|uniref:hypothetical protein n=1 Tax=Deinococcus sp. TaxID=47478 RepID=UPI003C7B8EDD